MLERAQAYGSLHFIALLEDETGRGTGKSKTGGSGDFVRRAMYLADVLDVISPSDLTQ
ncbi:hypothetical protein GR216_34880 [Rhizobium leguminosarum]|nr:hypothetical protein [Rhizobium leguminosarum]NEJ03119.1 hypothetical protein [Rhizobium ruizarguesonis]NEJ40235.1 hypothetical protein [Rhizobium ruizarguesonis]